MPISFYIALLISAVHSYSPAPRWGQATSLISSSLFVQGGKQDPYNSQSYTAAPAFGDLLFLQLSTSFSVDNPPWALISDPSNATDSPGPAVAWHTLSASNSSTLLLLGGLPNPTVPSLTAADSGFLLNVYNRLVPQFTAANWVNEPIRRIHHAAVSAITGEVYFFGGEKADDSLIAFADHYVFNPATSSFTLLPADGAPPALTGHAAIILPNGQILVFGGLAPSEGLLPFSSIWIFDTKTNTWSQQTVASSTVPQSRRAFAYVLVDDNTILIHGGCDGVFQNTFADGWIYSINTTTWTSVPELAALGKRRDHFAASYGGQVIFGFGYGDNGPADAALSVFDPASQTFQPTFTPPPPDSTATPTIPLPSATDTGVASTHTGSDTASSVHPTSTKGSGGGGGNNGGGEDGGGGGGGGSGGGSGGGDDPTGKPEGSTSKTSVIAIGAVLGVLALVSAGLGAVWYMRRQQRRRWAEGGMGGVFSPLNDEEGGAAVAGGGAMSAARMYDGAPQEKGLVGAAVEAVAGALSAGGAWVAGALGLGAGAVVGAGVAATERDRKQRRDMLADEDTRDFGYGWDDEDSRSNRLGRFRQGSGGSTWSLMSVFRPTARRQGSAASGGSFGSRLGAGAGAGAGLGEEKDPFRDDNAYRDLPAGAAAATRPHAGRRQESYTSVNTVNSAYLDPFADPITSAAAERDIALAGPGALLANIHNIHQHHARGGPLSPVTEVSRSSGSQSQSASSHDHAVLSPFDSRSRSSFGFSSASHHSPALPGAVSPAPSTGRPHTMSIVDQPDRDHPIRRSDTWWARFASRSLLDRRSSGRASAPGGADLNIRDPNPLPQRLGFVTEEKETASVLRERSDGSDVSARAGPVAALYRAGGHGKSMSSLQTQRTADSAAIERMGGNVDVVLRGNRQSGSTSTRGSVTTHGGDGARNSWQPGSEGEDDEVYTSPIEMVPAAAFGLPSPPPRQPSPPRPPMSTSSSGSSGVSDRIKAYERRMSQDVAPPLPATNTKQREERAKKKPGNYGLVARPSLFVANPDHRAREGSGDS
ncbi:hypothetical protein B0H17DRAFT_1191930 [Mycena rosella]|uniref:Galactose oxidase n=1 Tax=Mycena rosella TaxID=1033263 RepID=A0AAD7MA57_MYCRO|nr:hypothetical protein B0H17DRAFT_1191930 [Mycena rosella]